MIDYSRIVDDLRSAICSANPEWVDFLRSAAADYAVACEEVNERLRRCGEYLRKGLRSEAIQLAEVDPNLLDCVAILDFPERTQCCEILAQYGIRTPTPLMLDVAADLNEAYSIERPMAALLQRHRLLALAHSPLRLRIGVLRELAKVDANNTIWQEDLIEFERERLKEFQQEVAEASQRADLPMLTALEKELRTNGWQELPPPQLVQWTSGLRLTLASKQGRDELERLTAQLNDAFSAFDVVAGRSLRERWRQLAAQLPLVDGDPMHDWVQPAFDWLDQEGQREQTEADFRQATDSLESALDRNVPLNHIERAYVAANRFGTELPGHLLDRYANRVARLQEQASRRRKIKLALIGLGSMLVAGVVAAAIYIPIRISHVNSHADRLEKLMDANRFAEADEYLAKLSADSPSVAASARIQDLDLQLKGLKQTEAERHASFDQVANQVVAALAATRLDPATLEKLQKLAKTAAEKARLLELESQATKVAGETRAIRDKEFLSQVKAFVEHVESVEKNASVTPAELRRSVVGLHTELETLDASTAGLSGNAKAQLKAVRNRVLELDTQIARREEQEVRETRLTNAVGNHKRFQSALTDYVRDFAGTDRATEFRRVAEESTLWPTMDAWNALVAQWQRKPLTDLTPDEAAERSKLTAKFIEEFKGFPGCDGLGDRLPFLNPITQRNENGQRLEQKLTRLFTDPLVADLWMVVHKDGRRFYGRSEPKVEPDRLNGFKYVIQFDFVEKSIGLRAEDVLEKGLAPQSKIAKQLNQTVKEVTDSTWDRTFFSMLKLIHEAPDIDPILRLNLLQQTHEIGRQGSLVFEKTFDDYAAILKRAEVNPFANWLDPSDEDAKQQRKRAQEVMAKLPDFATVAKRARAEGDKVRRPVGRTFRWVGWLQRTSDGKWEGRYQTTPDGSGSLFVVAKGNGSDFAIEEIGQVKSGVPRIASSAKNTLVEGRPLYFSAAAN
jgi:hypothetical protein